MSADTLDIKLLGKEYRVACAPDEREALQAAVRLVDEKMAEIAGKTRSTGERLAVMAALNIAHELLAQKSPVAPADFDSRDLKRRIAGIEARLDEALSQQEDLF